MVELSDCELGRPHSQRKRRDSKSVCWRFSWDFKSIIACMRWKHAAPHVVVPFVYRTLVGRLCRFAILWLVDVHHVPTLIFSQPEADCLLSCLLSGIIRASGCGRGVYWHNKSTVLTQSLHLVATRKLTKTGRFFHIVHIVIKGLFQTHYSGCLRWFKLIHTIGSCIGWEMCASFTGLWKPFKGPL